MDSRCKKIAFAREYKDSEGVWQADIWIMNPDGSNIVHLTDNKAEKWHPDISPDGEQIVLCLIEMDIMKFMR
jgi:TolB protein